MWIWDREETKKYFLAGGGKIGEFGTLWNCVMKFQNAQIKAIEKGEYHCADGGIFYILAGRK